MQLHNLRSSVESFFKDQRKLALFLVFLAIVFNAIFLLPEFLIQAPAINDEVLHFSSVKAALSALKSGQGPTDFWFSEIGLGYPLFHSYQHLAQTFLAVLAWLLPFFSIAWLFNFFRWLLMVLFPLSILWAMRRLDFDWLESGFAALVSSLLSTAGLMGLEFNSYLWQGTGLFPQLWAMFFLPLAIAETYQFYQGRTKIFWPVLLAGLTLLSQVIYGYIIFLSVLIAVFLKPSLKEIFERSKRFLAIILLSGLAAAYFLIPLWLDRLYIYRSLFEPAFKYDSFGVFEVVSKLFRGELLDFGRLPVLTVLLFLAIAFLVSKKQYLKEKENHRFLLAGLIFWLFLFFGRSFWGGILDLLPGSEFLPLHRFLAGFQLFSIFILGSGLGLFLKEVVSRKTKLAPAFFLVLAIVFLPVFKERISVYSNNARLKLQNRQAFIAFAPELSDIKNEILRLGPGRIFAGLPGSFGNFPYYLIGDIPLYALFPQAGLDSFGYAYHAEALTTDLRLNFDDTKPEQYNLFNIRYVVLHNSWTPPRFYSLVKKFENYSLFQVLTTGYFDLVSSPAVFYGGKKDFYQANLNWLNSGLLKSNQYPILELGDSPTNTFGLSVFPLSQANQALLSKFSQAGNPVGRIVSETVRPGEYSGQFWLDKEGYLLLKTNFHPGWKAFLDGNEVAPVMLSPGFIGLKAGPGSHWAVFKYQAPGFRPWLLLFGVLLLLALAVGPNIRSLLIDRKQIQ